MIRKGQQKWIYHFPVRSYFILFEWLPNGKRQEDIPSSDLPLSAKMKVTLGLPHRWQGLKLLNHHLSLPIKKQVTSWSQLFPLWSSSLLMCLGKHRKSTQMLWTLQPQQGPGKPPASGCSLAQPLQEWKALFFSLSHSLSLFSFWPSNK